MRALAAGGVGPGLPRKRRDQWIFLGAASAALPADALDERALNEKLKEWLAALGPRVELDHVTLRRALVDEGFVERTADGGRYARSRAFERNVVFASHAVEEAAMNLAQESCVPCRGDAPPATADEIAAWSREIPSWTIAASEGEPRLVRVFKFADFDAALAFANRVGAIAALADHHPALLVEWGKVTVSWWTHAIRGLHRNDFVMAAKTDTLAG